jgi:NAD(P)-dependent dehydrogenase (short-subunit alcohol dehydrogenase family)
MVTLDGKVAVITGGNSGMGLAAAGDDHRDECIDDVDP